jgi:hypothetical protein
MLFSARGKMLSRRRLRPKALIGRERRKKTPEVRTVFEVVALRAREKMYIMPQYLRQ